MEEWNEILGHLCKLVMIVSSADCHRSKRWRIERTENQKKKKHYTRIVFVCSRAARDKTLKNPLSP